MDSETYADESFLVERLATRPGAPRMALGSGSIALRTNLHQCVILGIIGMIGQKELPVDLSWLCHRKSTLDLQSGLWVDGGFMFMMCGIHKTTLIDDKCEHPM